MLRFVVAEPTLQFMVTDDISRQGTVTVQLITYFQNDSLPVLSLTCVDEEGQPFPLTDVYQVRLKLRKNNTALPLLVDAAMTPDTDLSKGLATYTFNTGVLTANGKYTGEVSLVYGTPTPAKAVLTLSGTATAAGTLDIQINSLPLLSVPVLNNQAAAGVTGSVAKALVDAITPSLGVTAALDPANAGKVILTSTKIGLLGNADTLTVQAGLPTGLTVLPAGTTAFAGGLTPATRTRTLGQFSLVINKSIATA